jgi:hypothetical protein
MDVKLGSLTLKNEHRLQAFGNWVKRIFGLKRNQIMKLEVA